MAENQKKHNMASLNSGSIFSNVNIQLSCTTLKLLTDHFWGLECYSDKTGHFLSLIMVSGNLRWTFYEPQLMIIITVVATLLS